MLCRPLLLVGLIVTLEAAVGTATEPLSASPESRALAYLAQEVPRWSRENRCFSCHNNGDAARALYAGIASGFRIAPDTLADTTAWLNRADRWEHNGGEGDFSDKRLARIQFTVAAAAASRAEQAIDRARLTQAATLIIHDQAPDGSWPIEGENEPGSPIAYSRSLATALVRESLQTIDPTRYRESIARAECWLIDRPIKSVTDASVMLITCASLTSSRISERHARSLALLHRGQSEEGGWGPFVNSPPEPFDTAIVLIALAGLRTRPEAAGLAARGRAFLVARQQEDGSWIETTRPPNAQSYAQRVSTTAWAALALLASRPTLVPGVGDPKR
jgi:hypothetical protein